MNVARINEMLFECLGQIDANQQPLEGSVIIDLYLQPIALNVAKVRSHSAEMIALLRDWPTTSFGINVPALGEEISYTLAGAVLHNQIHAFILFAYGKQLGWWEILDPNTVFGYDKHDPVGQDLARSGMISISGYLPRVAV